MTSIEISMKLDLHEFPMLKHMKKKDLDQVILDMFRAGYKIHFPNQDEKLAKVEFEELRNSIDILRNDVVEKVNEKIDPLNNSLEKLLGLQTASSKKGELGENVIENAFLTRYGDIKYEKKNTTPHSGDAWLHLPTNQIILIECKNYTNTINKDEVAKMEFDMKHNHIRFALFISLNASIQNFRDMDFHTFTHNGETYFAIMMANLSNEIIKLDLGYSMIRKLMSYYEDTSEFPWIQKNIKEDLNQINEMINRNYMLRDDFYKMEKSINESLDIYYKRMREYQYDMETKMKKLTDDINSTVSKSLIKKPKTNQDFIEIHKSKKIFPVVVHLIDIINKKKWVMKEVSKNKYDINSNGSKVGSLEVQLKKAILSIDSNQLELVFNAGNSKLNNSNLKILETNF